MNRALVMVGTIALVFGDATVRGDYLAPPAQEQEDRDTRLVAGILRGDVRSVIDAGNTRRQTFIPALRQLLTRTRRNDEMFDDIQLALAKLGESHELQVFLCYSRNARDLPTQTAFGEIGGWYGIRGLLFLFTPEWDREVAKYAAEWNRKHPEGFSHTPDFFNLVTLMGLLPQAPASLHIPSTSNLPPLEWDHEREREVYRQRERLVREWPTWVAAHEAELRTMQPTGEGVDFSIGACNMKTGEPRKRRR